MSVVSEKPKYILDKIVVTGAPVPGPAGPPGPPGSGVTLPIESTDVNYGRYGYATVLAALNALLYKAPAVLTLSNSIGMAEKGSTVNTINFAWTREGSDITAQRLSGSGISTPVELGTSVLAHTRVGAGLTSNAVFTLTIVDALAQAQRSTNINFVQKIHYGAKTPPVGYDSAFILSLTGELKDNRTKIFTADCSGGRKAYFAAPTAYGEPVFYVGGFMGGFLKVAEFSHTNASGFSEAYAIYASVNADLGNITVTVQ